MSETYENVYDAIFTETELAKMAAEGESLKADLRKLVEKWRKEKDFLGSDREALPYGDCADELEAVLNKKGGE